MEIKSFKELTEGKMESAEMTLEKAVKSVLGIIKTLDKYDYKKNKELAKVYDMSTEASEFCHDNRGDVKKVAEKALKMGSDMEESDLKFIIKNADMIELSMTINTNDFSNLSDALAKAINIK